MSYNIDILFNVNMVDITSVVNLKMQERLKAPIFKKSHVEHEMHNVVDHSVIHEATENVSAS